MSETAELAPKEAALTPALDEKELPAVPTTGRSLPGRMRVRGSGPSDGRAAIGAVVAANASRLPLCRDIALHSAPFQQTPEGRNGHNLWGSWPLRPTERDAS